MRELLSDPVEAGFLLAAERRVEAVQRRLYYLRRVDHRLQPLFHGVEPAWRCERRVIRARGLHDLDRLAGRVLQLVQLGFLRVGWIDRVLNLLDRQVGETGLGLVAGVGGLRRVARLRIGGGRLWPELVEALLLLVAKGCIEGLERR